MSTTRTPGPGSANGATTPEAAANSVSQTMQQGLAAVMALPQQLMQASLETAGHAADFMNRRMRAQAALLGGFGQVTDTKGLAEAQRAFIEGLTRDYVQEMNQLADLARRNFAVVSALTHNTAGQPGLPARSS